MKCNKCGCMLQQGDVFCPRCGNRMDVAEKKAEPSSPDIYDIGHVWPEWKITGVLGKGSFGTVYEAVRRDSIIESRAAIKVVSIPVDSQEAENLRLEGYTIEDTRAFFKGVADSFAEEIRIMESFKGMQNIVSVEDYKLIEKADGMGWDIFIRMELLTPFNVFACDKKFTESDVISIGVDICNALEICNKRKIIHRDVKPENIFVNEFGYYKLGDFGIARSLESKTGSLSQKGTYNYMAPEVYFGKTYDERADIYSLGIVLYKLLNNNMLPFLDPGKQLLSYGERKEAAERRFRGEKLPPPCNASPALASVILKACDYNVFNRFSSASQMKNALMAVSKGEYRENAFVPSNSENMHRDENSTVMTRHPPEQRRGADVNFPNRGGFSPDMVQKNFRNDMPPARPQKVTTFNQPEKKKSGKIIALIAAALVLLLIVTGSIAGGVALYMGTKDKNEEPSGGVSETEFSGNEAELSGDEAEFDGHKYLLINDPAVDTYEKAKQYCEDRGGYLAAVTSKEENDFLFDYFYENCEYPAAFIGRELKENSWVNGEEFSYNNINEQCRETQAFLVQQLAFARQFKDGTWIAGDFENFGYVNEAVISSASASSVLSEENIVHNAGKIFDGKHDTAWVEGDEGFGIGESVTVNFDKEYTINEIQIAVGYQRTSELYDKNARPCDLKLTFSDGRTEMIVCEDKMGTQSICFDAVTTDSVTITIISAYKGSKFEDTAICEAAFFCANPTPSFICEWE